ncbi:hypothetical protein AB1K91_18405 [Terribacillus sp. 179-K 1B1 HS]|uniref:hypothetical protein n=1 Tax=Terribacillus sp. 179-K 1B1 HS TaxID=3142388 RepID=UPI00399F127E
MKQNTKLLIGASSIFGILISTPLTSHAESVDDYIISGQHSVRILGNNVEAVINPSVDPQRASFYGSQVKSLDSKASNRLYKVTDNGYTYWSPIRSKNGSGGVSNGEYIYENLKTAKLYGIGGSDSSRYLGDLWLGDSDITRNFKTVQNIAGKEAEGTTREGMKKLGVYVERSPEVNNGGNYKNQSGSWRFAGYAGDGSSLQSTRFPGDFVAPAVNELKWDNYKDYGSRLFNQTAFDTATWNSAKKNLVQRLLAQYPSMKKMHSVNQWMKILSLQTEPEENPINNNKQDGKYGGAAFAAYHSGGSKYRTFTLYADKSDGYMNLNLRQLRLVENDFIDDGVHTTNRRIVKEVNRVKAESREIEIGDIADWHKAATDKVVPGKTYRIETNVENLSKVTKTKHTPLTVDTGLALNYKSSLEESGQYDKDYDDVSGKSTGSGSISKGGRKGTAGTITIPKDAKPGSTIRVGAIINDEYRKAGDNLNAVDDDLSLTVQVASFY